MNVHKNARQTPRGRAVMITRIEVDGWSVERAASAAGVSRRTAYRWRARYRRDGEAGLADRSSRRIAVLTLCRTVLCTRLSACAGNA